MSHTGSLEKQKSDHYRATRISAIHEGLISGILKMKTSACRSPEQREPRAPAPLQSAPNTAAHARETQAKTRQCWQGAGFARP